MIDIKNIKVGDKVKVTEVCSYCLPGTMGEKEVNPGDLGEVVEIEEDPIAVWPLHIQLEGHEGAYLFGLDEVELV